MGTMGWNGSPPLLAFCPAHFDVALLGNVLPSSTELLEIPTRVWNDQSMSTLAELSVWSCSASFHRFCNAFAVDQNDTVLN